MVNAVVVDMIKNSKMWHMLHHVFIVRECYHPCLTYLPFLVKIFSCKKRYAAILKRIRGSTRKLRLVFVTAGASKWKCQSVYDAARDSQFLSPVVLCGEEEVDFYKSIGCDSFAKDMDDIDSDIVVYQDPWSELATKYSVWRMSKRALCCYVPYSIESIAQGGRSERFDYHHLANFHSLMFACFQWSSAYAKHYKSAQFPWERAGSVLGFGHPSLDVYNNAETKNGEYIIYAPHFGFEYNGIRPISSIGTFPWSGKAVLEYARSHPEQKWLFKPHPKLRDRLVEIGFMSKEAVDSYYSEWERIAEVCYDGNYAAFFLDSRAMVTDSNSFLLEYMAVDKPLIHLVPEKTNMVPSAEAAEIFKTFYIVSDVAQLTAALKLVVEDGMDPMRDKREKAAVKADILNNHAGRRIVSWLREVCWRN